MFWQPVAIPPAFIVRGARRRPSCDDTQQEIRKAVAQRIRDGLDSGRKHWRPWFKRAGRSAAYTQQPSARFASREEAVRACKQVVSATAATSDSCSSQTHLKHTSKVSRGANHGQEIMNSRKSNHLPGSGVFSGSMPGLAVAGGPENSPDPFEHLGKKGFGEKGSGQCFGPTSIWAGTINSPENSPDPSATTLPLLHAASFCSQCPAAHWLA